ncbi:MAG: ABC transporter ATP-binding protein, partial [Actinomycetia bacterium]|nr:ABC transporter ATP-binding protein [Actinomycetes bacterium]
VTALVATHDAQLLALADRVLELRDGRIVTGE